MPISIEQGEARLSSVGGGVSYRITSHGAFASIRDGRVGEDYLSGEEPTGWRLITSLGPWLEHPCLERDNEGEFREIENGVELRFARLRGETGETLDMALTLRYLLEGEALLLSAEIDNRSGETARELQVPLVSGFTRPAPGDSGSLALPLEMGTILDAPLENLPVEGRFGLRPRPAGNFLGMDFWPHYPLPYPGVACMPWMDFYGRKGGLYLGYHDRGTPTLALLARKRAAREDFQLGFARYPFVAPGSAASLGEFRITPHEGDWHRGADRYRGFALTKLAAEASSPEWIKRAPGLAFSFHVGQNRKVLAPYEAMIERFERCRALGLELPLFVFGWVRSGFDNGYPEYEPDPRLGGEARLESVIGEIVGRGGKVILYTQGRLIDTSTRFYRRKGRKLSLKNEYGSEYYDEYSFNALGTIYPGKVFALGCPGTEAWFRQLRRQIDIVMGLGASGILFDQLAGDPPFLCFDASHRHPSPDLAFEAKIGLLRRLGDYARSRDPEFVVMTELVCDAYLQCVDLSHGMATHRTEDGPRRFLPEMYRYTFPRHRVTSRGAATKDAINQVLALGLPMEYNAANPELPYLEAALKLRSSLGRFFVDGSFVDEDGLSGLAAPLAAKAHLSADGGERLVAVMNRSGEGRAARLAAPRSSSRWTEIALETGIEVERSSPPEGELELELGPWGLKLAILR
jgi:hypothetical protein